MAIRAPDGANNLYMYILCIHACIHTFVKLSLHTCLHVLDSTQLQTKNKLCDTHQELQQTNKTDHS